MAELQAGISFWLSVVVRSLRTFPEFLGNNWPGVLLALVWSIHHGRKDIRKHFDVVRRILRIRTAEAYRNLFAYAGSALMRTNWKPAFMIVILFFLGNVLTEAYRDYAAASRRTHDKDIELADVRQQIINSATSCQLQTNEIRGERDKGTARNEVLERQNRDEQVLIAGCQSEALKLLAPRVLETTPIYLDSDNANVEARRSRILVLTNKPLSPARLVVGCSQGVTEITGVSLNILGGPPKSIAFSGRSAKLSATVWDVQEDGAWTEKNPLLVTIIYKGDERTVCSLNPR